MGLIAQEHMVARRVRFRLKGNRGVVPDPVRDTLRSRGGYTVADPEHLVKLRRDEAGTDYGYSVPRLEFDVQEIPGNLYRIKCTHCILDERDADKAEGLVRSALRRAGLKDEAEIERTWRQFQATLVRHESREPVVASVAMNTGGHQLGMTKIAYEMAWYWLGDAWLDDPAADAYRKALHKHPGGFTGVLVSLLTADQLAGPTFMGLDDSRVHLLFLLKNEHGIYVIVKVLGALGVLFLVSSSPGTYLWPVKDFVIMDVVDRVPKQALMADVKRAGGFTF
ncbi:MAG TPA: hypothetical protein VII30_09610 [Gemmatimonadaceae bacterium]